MSEINPYKSPTLDDSEATAGPGEALLRVTRRWQYQDCLRAYEISVDGIPHDKIRTDQTISIPIAAGELIVVASVDWAKSPPVVVQARPGNTIELEVGGALKGWKLVWAGYYTLFAPQQYLTLERI